MKIQSAKVLNARIDAFGKVVLSTQQEAQDIGVQCLAHYAEHGDLTLFARFVGGKIGSKKKGERKYTITDDFPGVCGVMRKSIVAWAATYSDLRFNGDGMIYRMNRASESFKAFHPTIDNVLSEAGQAVNVSMAEENPWFEGDEAKRASSVRPLDLLNLITIAASITKRLAKAKEDDAENGGVIVEGQLAKMEAFAAAIAKATADFEKKENVNVVLLQAEREARAKAAAEAPVVVDRAAGAEVAAG
jgi:hypothetical protein